MADVVLTAESVARVVREAIPHLACELPPDMREALVRAAEAEEAPLGCAALGQLCANFCVAAEDQTPICQDTGTVWVCLEVGPDVTVPGDVFSGVDGAVAEAYEAAHLRKSLVRDAFLDRANTQDNTPAFTEVRFCEEPGVARLHIMLKGGGSDNASRVVMLTPGAGRQGIVDTVVTAVREKAANACPPCVIGVGIGATFDKVAGLAKHALMRPVGSIADDPQVADLEAELLAAVNATGIGAAGLGGAATALAVHVETAACHIAALPVAVNIGCSALRRVTIDLRDGGDPFASFADAKPASGDVAAAAAVAPEDVLRLQLPLTREALAGLRAGQYCLLSGPLFTLRDAGHMRLLDEVRAQGSLPYGLEGQTIFYAGPTPAAADRPFGAVGPTTASRMDFATPELLAAGVVATIGKGDRSAAVIQACKDTGSVYFAAVGGAASLCAKCVETSETLGYDDLGTEALRAITVKDFPVIVGIDTLGNDVYAR